MAFNAWLDPWIPVHTGEHETSRSLREVLANAEALTDLASTLFPVEREALLRLLYTTAAVGLRAADEDDVDTFGETGTYPATALTHLDQYTDRFDLHHPERPFLQVWGRPPHPSDKPRPIEMLDVHVPGPTSSLWGQRRTPTFDTAALVRGLTTSWFHSKRSNSAAPHGLAQPVKGAPGDGGAKDMTLHWVGTNLGLTLAAAIPMTWVEDAEDLPAWLDQDTYPTGRALARDAQSLWRSTYTPNRPVLLRDADGTVTGYVLGCVADTAAPVPAVALSEKVDPKPGRAGSVDARVKAILANVHDRDLTRAWVEHTKKDDTTYVAKAAPDVHRLLSAEGAVHWFASGTAEGLAAWQATHDRVAGASVTDPAWRLGCYLEEADPKAGTRIRSTWVVVDPRLLNACGEAATTVLAYVAKAVTCIGRQAGAASEGGTGTKAATSNQARAALYAALDDVVLDALRGAVEETLDHHAACREVRDIAVRVMAEQTEPLRTPATLRTVESARGRFARLMGRDLPRPATVAAESTKDAA